MSKKYFASQDSKECASILLAKADIWCNTLETNGYLNKLRAAWSAYHGAYYTDVSSGHKITFGGTEGELARLPVNQIRNFVSHTLNMITANRPTMEARAANTDYRSLTQTLLANGLLDYYMREKRLERYLKTAVEYAIVMGSGWIKMSWNAVSGEMYDFNEDTQTPIYEGDVEFSNLSPFDVIVDSSKESSQAHDWIMCRTWKNRYDLVAKYPEYEDKILALPTKSDLERFHFTGVGMDTTDDVAVWEFYHRRSESVSDGRYLLFLSPEIHLYDGPLPYRKLPIFRISPADILGSPYGYTNVFDLLPLQDALNSMYTNVLSGQNAFGLQNIIVPRGSDIAISELTSGLNIIETNMQMGKPEPLNLLQTPPETFKFIQMIEQLMETLSGINSVSRGQPEASLRTGAALALVQSMAIQFMSSLQQSYVELIEDVGTSLILMLKDFAAVPRVAAIVGRSNKSYMREFKGDDLSAVNRVIVDVGNPLARTTAGRVEMAQQMLQMGAIKTPSEYFTVLNTGKLDVMIEGTQAELLLVKGENERMMDGQIAPVLAIDDHKTHIVEHKAILSDPDLRNDPQLVQNVLNHIQEHISALQTSDPNLLQLLGQQPLPPPQPQGPPQQMPPQQDPQQGGQMPQGGPASQPPGNPGAPPQGGVPESLLQQVAPGQGNPNMPSVPTPPAPFNNLPTNPANA